MIDNLCPQVVPAIPYVAQLGELYDNYQQLIESALDETTAGKLAQRLDVIEDAITTTEIDSMF